MTRRWFAHVMLVIAVVFALGACSSGGKSEEQSTAPASVTGQVPLSTGVDATLRLTRDGADVATTHPDATGHYEFGGLPAGFYDLEFSTTGRAAATTCVPTKKQACVIPPATTEVRRFTLIPGEKQVVNFS